MRPYATWKYVLLIVVLLFGALYSAPNLYGEQPAVQVALDSGDAVPADLGDRIEAALKGANLEPESAALENGRWVVRFKSGDTQLLASDVLKRALGNSYVVALNLAPKTPEWLRKVGAKPMALGLDLRGGVHFLLQVDIKEVQKKTMESLIIDLPAQLRGADIRYSGKRLEGDAVILEFPDADKLEAARRSIAKNHSELLLTTPPSAPLTLEARLQPAELKRINDAAVKANLTVLKSRVNQLGVAEPVVQREGVDRILVQLPGVQDTGQVQQLLGATATLEYHAVSEEDATQAASSGIVPAGYELYYQRDTRRPYLLNKEIITSGFEMKSADATMDTQTNTPAVSVHLNGAGASRMLKFTQKNIGKPMAVLLRERVVSTSYNAKGEAIRSSRQVDEIISVASIRGVFGAQFQTTGLASKEAHDLAIMLRAGALAAPVDIVETRTIGPSLGADNIRRGFHAAILGLSLVAAFMVFYYRLFGFFAIAALSLNLLIIVAFLSIFGATLSMPGIAGIVLTMGIAVDANVLIYERIREELRNGSKPQTALEAGYDRAFLTIADANITTLIAAAALGAFAGAGPVRGFAITLGIGILASQFTAIVGSRALAALAFEKRSRMTDLPIW